jgi:hypothetical protein
MAQTKFFWNFLIRFSSFLSIVFLVIGVSTLAGAHLGLTVDGGTGFPIVIGGTLLACFSLIAANVAHINLSKELKEAGQIATRISEGDVDVYFDESKGDLKSALREISDYLAEKTAIADQIASGDSARLFAI